MSAYEELPCNYLVDMKIEKLEDLLERAKKAGHNVFEVDIETCPYYGGIDSVTIRTRLVTLTPEPQQL